MPTRLRDVADRVNLSPGLVSKVLNGRPGVWASAETRQRILDTAREMGYRPNAAARTLRSGKTYTVGFLFSLPSSHREIIEAMAERLSDHGYRLLVQALPTPESLLEELAEAARTRACDGVILWNNDRDTERQGRLMVEMEMPFVAKGRFERTHPDWLQADFDHEWMMADAVSYVTGRGRRRIAYMGYTAEDSFVHHLYSGFAAAVERETGAPPRDEYVVHAPGGSSEFEQFAEDLFSRKPHEQPDAVVIGAGRTAWQAVELALARRGRRIGDGAGEVAVAGTGDSEMALLFGEGRVYQRMASLDLATAMVDRLLVPLLLERPVTDRIVRLRPPLTPAVTFNLTERGIQLPRRIGSSQSDD